MKGCGLKVPTVSDDAGLSCRCGSAVETVLAGNGRTGIDDTAFMTVCVATRTVIGGDLRGEGGPAGEAVKRWREREARQ